MPRGQGKHLTDEQRDRVREMRQRYPRMTLKEIGRSFGVSASCVCGVLSGESAARKAIKKDKPRVVMQLPTAAVQQPDSIIRPIPLSRLMAGR